MALTIRPTDEENKVIEKLQNMTGKAASKSLMIASEYYIDGRIKDQKKIVKLQDENEAIKYKYQNLIDLLSSKDKVQKEIQNAIKKGSSGRSSGQDTDED